jgi:MinD-like ATPase involved in chromosome partitioning or flagellar assembly
MMINFGETFDRVQECLQEINILTLLVPKLDSITIIRDVQGKVRLFLEPLQSTFIEESDTAALGALLSEKLGDYYGKDIWIPKRNNDAYSTLIDIIKNDRLQADWDNQSILPRWYILERHIAKQAWTENRSSQPPWQEELVYDGHKPAIVSFFSFKGGGGRTSALVATALTLARNGHRVATVDLDLEAPGLATIFLPDISINSGVIDYLLEKPIQKNDWRLRTIPISDKNLLGEEGQVIHLFPAGTVDGNYLEKLARLDFQNLVNSDLQNIMKEMLTELEASIKPLDFILMDARAGFHDIGGLTIANLSHGVVIFGTQSRQSWAGLTHVIRHLAKPEIDDRLPLILAHAMAPAIGTSGRGKELADFREQAYLIFKENYYSELEDVPNSNDESAPFLPIIIPYQESLRGDISLFSNDVVADEHDRLSNLVRIMTDEPYSKIAEKLCEIFQRRLNNLDK